MRNAIAQVFIHGCPELIQTDNGKEFTNKALDTYLEGIDVKYLYGSQYHLQSQGAIEALNKTVKNLCQQHMIMQRTIIGLGFRNELT